MKTTTLQLRIDEKTKRDVQKIIDKLGLDMSTAITMFLRQVIVTKSIPFQARTINGFTPKYEAMILRETADALKNAKRYKNVDDLMKDLYV